MAQFQTITVEEVTNSFPTHNIETIKKQPTYSTLKPMMKGLRKCTEAVSSTQKKGHLYLVMDDASFFK